MTHASGLDEIRETGVWLVEGGRPDNLARQKIGLDILRLLKCVRIMQDALMHYKCLEEMGNVDHDHLAEEFLLKCEKILEGGE